VLKRLFCILMTFVICVGIMTGCNKDVKSMLKLSGTDTSHLWNTVTDTSELPDWEGKKIQLTYWWAQNGGNIKRNKIATNDAVTDEIFRITGVKYDAEKSYDNNGASMVEKLGKLAAANDYPQIVEYFDKTEFTKMVNAGLVYDLTDLIPKYCPNTMLQFPKEKFPDVWSGINLVNGKMYQLPVNLETGYVGNLIDQADIKDPNSLKMLNVAGPSSRGFIYVRDDILKMIFPSAKTKKELEKLMIARKGAFSIEDYQDVQIKSPQEFYDFLYKIKNLGLKENGKEIYPIWSHGGTDNWSALTILSGMLYGYVTDYALGSGNSYFTYWDNNTNRLEVAFKQPWFKDILKTWNKLVNDDVASKESIIDNMSSFKEKLNSGLYAVTYGSSLPDETVLKNAGKTFGYRKVYLDIPPNYNKYTFIKRRTIHTSIAILKPNVKEEDLPQILKFYDFMQSQAGRKLAVWGTKSAGLFEEDAAGNRKYKDKGLENDVLYQSGTGMDVMYNLVNSAWPGYPYNSANINHPIFSESEVLLKNANVNNFYNYAYIEPLKQINSIPWSLIDYSKDTRIPGIKKFWSARPGFEDALKKCFVAKTDQEFENLYNQMLQIAETNGLTDEVINELNNFYAQDNKDYIDNLRK